MVGGKVGINANVDVKIVMRDTHESANVTWKFDVT